MAQPFSEDFTAWGFSFSKQFFSTAGDEIPLHMHNTDHLDIVLQGEFYITSDKSPPAIVNQGSQAVLFRAGGMHSIQARTDGALILRIEKMPNTVR